MDKYMHVCMDITRNKQELIDRKVKRKKTEKEQLAKKGKYSLCRSAFQAKQEKEEKYGNKEYWQ